MKRAIASMLALPGIHLHLSAKQKQDIAIAAVQTTPGAASAGAARLGGLPLSAKNACKDAMFKGLALPSEQKICASVQVQK